MHKFSFILSLIALCLLTGCNLNNDNQATINLVPNTDFEKEESEMFTNNDYETSFDVNDSVMVRLLGDTIDCDSDKAVINGSTITLNSNATYIISGILNNGKIIIDAKNCKPHIILNNVSITNESFSPIYILEADKVFITLNEGTNNSLSNTSGFTLIDDNYVDGVIYSKADLTLNGKGFLAISSPKGNGIVCKDDLVFAGGNYNIKSLNHGLDANDSIRINNSNFTIYSDKDGIHCENSSDEELGYIYISGGTFDIAAGDDAISSDLTLQIESATFNIYTGPNYTTDNTSLKGIKATSTILISSGSFIIDSYDDAIHSNSSIVINGGTFRC